ncbi:MAG TPA: MG2 domain-containing protein [Nitrosopumilaceae archaeon]|nr:MG2 domain-containing protein [Nitrosopumilaceae archaeon]
MNYTDFKSYNPSKFLASIIVLCLAGLLVNFSSSSAFAQKEQIGLNADASAKINLGKTEIASNSTTQANASAGNSGGNKGGSNENYPSHSNAQAQYHENYKSSYEKISANSENSFTVETDKHLYKPGDNIKIEGSIWSGLITELGGANLISIQVLDNNGTIVNDGKIQVNGNGQYNTQFTLSDNARNGAYTINAKIDVSANLVGSLTLKTQGNLQSSAKFVVVSPNAFAVKAEGKDFDVKLASNSNVSNLQFDEQGKKISFTVSGETGTKGTTDITIPKSLLSGNISVMIDGQVMSQADVIETADTQDETTLEINYHHSTHTIEIVGTNAVPEFGQLAPIVLAASIMSIIILSSKRIINR